MTAAETHHIVAILKDAYPRQEISEGTLDIYAEHLASLPFDLGAQATRQHIAESQFFPTVAELRSRAAAIKRGRTDPTPEEPEGERLTSEQLAALRGWSKTIGGRMEDLPDPEPMPAEDWFVEHGDDARRLIAKPLPRDRDSV